LPTIFVAAKLRNSDGYTAYAELLDEFDAGGMVVLSVLGEGGSLGIGIFTWPRNQMLRASTGWLLGTFGDALLLLQFIHEHVFSLVARETAGEARDMPSDRELQCLALASLGQSCEQSAKLLQISSHTVRFHLRKVREKLGSKTLPCAVATAWRDPAIAARLADHYDALPIRNQR
jgi:hypothetical protein